MPTSYTLKNDHSVKFGYDEKEINLIEKGNEKKYQHWKQFIIVLQI